MIKQEILVKLLPITDEEMAILAGEGVDKSIYTTHGGSVIRSKKLLSEGRLIRVRTHTRFVHFPEHTHDFIEAVYMCSGQTTHIINGKKLILKEGELLFLGQNARQEILPAGEKDIAVYLIANDKAVPFYEKLGMEKADDVMQFNHIDWTEFTVQ